MKRQVRKGDFFRIAYLANKITIHYYTTVLIDIQLRMQDLGLFETASHIFD